MFSFIHSFIHSLNDFMQYNSNATLISMSCSCQILLTTMTEDSGSEMLLRPL